MRRKDFIAGVIKLIDREQQPTGRYWVYCDRSKSLKVDRQNTYFLRLKYPCYSSKVKINFDEYRHMIREYMKSLGGCNATIHLRHTFTNGYGRYFFIEIIFHKGLPWKMNKSSITPTITHVNTTPAVPDPIKQLDENTVIINKQNLANLIKLDIENNPVRYTRSCHMTNDKLIELYNLVNL